MAELMADNIRPWGIHSIGSLYSRNVQAGLPDGRWVLAVPEPYHLLGLRERFRAAWWVFSGKAYAFEWPKAGDLEDALKEPT